MPTKRVTATAKAPARKTKAAKTAGAAGEAGGGVAADSKPSHATFYVRFPPHGDTHFRTPSEAEWKPCTIGIEPEYAHACRQLEALGSSRDGTSPPNELYLLEAFRIATSVNLYPPLWVLKGLNERFKSAFAKGMPISLDRAFGLSGKSLGKGRFVSAKERDALRNRDRSLCMAVFKLEAAGLSRREACKALSHLLARLPDGAFVQVGSGSDVLRRLDIGDRGIEKAVRAAESEWSGERDAALNSGATAWTAADKKQILAVFYPSELPKRLRPRN